MIGDFGGIFDWLTTGAHAGGAPDPGRGGRDGGQHVQHGERLPT